MADQTWGGWPAKKKRHLFRGTGLVKAQRTAVRSALKANYNTSPTSPLKGRALDKVIRDTQVGPGVKINTKALSKNQSQRLTQAAGRFVQRKHGLKEDYMSGIRPKDTGTTDTGVKLPPGDGSVRTPARRKRRRYNG